MEILPLNARNFSDNVLRDKSFAFVKTAVYNGYQYEVTLIVHNFLK